MFKYIIYQYNIVPVDHRLFIEGRGRAGARLAGCLYPGVWGLVWGLGILHDVRQPLHIQVICLF